MPRLLSADDMMPLVASMTDTERAKLLKWIASVPDRDGFAYLASPAAPGEFSVEDEPLSWEADGWDEFL